MAVQEICSEKKSKESVAGTFKSTCTVAVHYWYMKGTFGGFCQNVFEKKSFTRHFKEN